MNFTRIEYFMMAAKYLNFTKAASVLYISQPSLSKQIALLEEEIRVQLFDRSKRSLELTPAGQLLYSEFQRLIPEVNQIIEKVKQTNNETAGTLRVGCVEGLFLGEKATKIFSNFTSRAQRVELTIERWGFEELRNKILDGSIDVAFTISHQIVNMKDICSVEIEKRRRYIIISTSHRLAAKEHVGLEDLRDETFVLMDKEASLVSYSDIIEACQEHGYYPKIKYVPNNNTMLDYLELDTCVAFLDKSFIENRKDRLKCYPTKMKTSFGLVCIWKKSNANPSLPEFVNCLPE